MSDKRRSPSLMTARGEPLHEALVREFRRRIDTGEWSPQMRLPSVRELADQMGVSTVTVGRAYQTLASMGLLVAIRGNGTFVSANVLARRPDAPRDTSWQNGLLSSASPGRARLVILPGMRHPDVISLSTGATATDVFPIEWWYAAYRGFLSKAGHEAHRYTPPAGDPSLQTWVADYLKHTNIVTAAENVLITSGAQQGLNLVAQTLLRPGDVVMVERPTYIHALATFEALGAVCVEVQVDETGLRVDQAADLIARFRPRLLFTVPTGQQPTGVTQPLARRRELVEIARRYDVVVVEDDVVSEFSYDGPPPPAIKSFDTDGHVVYVKSFSKLVVPALRLGCIVAEGPLFTALVHAKSRADRCACPVSQRVFLEYVTGNHFRQAVKMALENYRDRRNAMLSALKAEMPAGVSWIVPTANWNLWMELPVGISSNDVAHRAALKGVVVGPTDVFYYRNPPDNTLRLTFSDNPIEITREGVRRLAEAVRDAIDDHARMGSRRPTELLVT